MCECRAGCDHEPHDTVESKLATGEPIRWRERDEAIRRETERTGHEPWDDVEITDGEVDMEKEALS